MEKCSFVSWLGTAFFASLERFSCINVSTSDMDDGATNDDKAGHRRVTASTTQNHQSHTSSHRPSSVV
ncbi:hypothetical protein SOVF_136110 [Spinacia oleracea]|nr:hypothetical protein SOVF_136110 [Spinacia oleracea]